MARTRHLTASLVPILVLVGLLPTWFLLALPTPVSLFMNFPSIMSAFGHPNRHVCSVFSLSTQAWRLGHVFEEEDVDLGDAVNALLYEKERRAVLNRQTRSNRADDLVDAGGSTDPMSPDGRSVGSSVDGGSPFSDHDGTTEVFGFRTDYDSPSSREPVRKSPCDDPLLPGSTH